MRSGLPALVAAVTALTSFVGCDSARTVEESSEAGACERCHGFPPPPGSLNADVVHPQATACEACHPTTVVSGTQLVEGGTHLNGRVDVAGVGHPMPFLTEHPAAALAGLDACASCHGTDFNGGTAGRSCNDCHATLLNFADWQTNCTFCHGTRTAGWTSAQPQLPAPPEAVEGGVTSTADRRVGAHQAHVTAGDFANAIACGECHSPAPTDLSHVDGSVRVGWGATASTGGATPTFDGSTCSNYCHGATLPGTRPAPTWAPPSAIACGACHDANPTTGRHPAVSQAHSGFTCGTCHGLGYTTTAVDKALHLNRTIDKTSVTGWNGTNGCTAACHSQSERQWR